MRKQSLTLLLHITNLTRLPLMFPRNCLPQQRPNELVHRRDVLIHLAPPELPKRPRAAEQRPLGGELLRLEE